MRDAKLPRTVDMPHRQPELPKARAANFPNLPENSQLLARNARALRAQTHSPILTILTPRDASDTFDSFGQKRAPVSPKTAENATLPRRERETLPFPRPKI